MSDEENWELSQRRAAIIHSHRPNSISSSSSRGEASSRCEMERTRETDTSCESVAQLPAAKALAEAQAASGQQRPQQPQPTNRLGGPVGAISSTQKQYFIRYSLNNSIRTRRSHLRRSSARRRSQTGAARRSGRQQRQVRFQPVAQAIEIDGHEQLPANEDRLHQATSQSEEGEGREAPFYPSQIHANIKQAAKRKQLERLQQQINKLSRKSRAQLSTSAKPLTRKLHNHLSQLKLGKLKLKSINQFAAQLRQQTSRQFAPTGSGSSSTSGSSGSSANNINSTSAHSSKLGSALASTGMKLLHRAHLKSASSASEAAASPIQQTFHIRHSAAAAKHNITLLNVNGQQKRQQQQQEAHFEDCDFPKRQEELEKEEEADAGWGSDFDDTAQESQDELSAASEQQPAFGASGDKNGYLLEIGKSSCDTRRIDDVIQDQGLSGHFKRLDLSASEFHAALEGNSSHPERLVAKHEPIEGGRLAGSGQNSTSHHREKLSQIRANLRMDEERFVDEVLAMASAEDEQDEDEEAAELASLEARQGYRQVRDKLKLILDRRLAASSISSNEEQRHFEAAQSQARQQQHDAGEIESRTGQVEVVVVACCEKRKQTTTATTNTIEHHHSSDRFDCQSNCSEASSTSSGGLDSNHSGSQDSGHSTQHSGYSSTAVLRAARAGPHGSSACRLHRGQQRESPPSPAASEQPLSSPGALSSSHGQISPSINQLLESGADEPADGKRAVAPAVAAHAQAQAPPKPNESEQQEPEVPEPDPLELERRHRFQQNRLLINSKLESMFRSRSGPAMALVSKQPTSQQASPSKSIQSCPTPTGHLGARPNSTLSSCSSVSLNNGKHLQAAASPLEAAMRVRLLEQQRQMSLKLKQKPRRRTAKRALNLISSTSHSPISHSSGSLCASSHEERSSPSASLSTTNSCTSQAANQHQSSYSPAQATSQSGKTRGSLTKQLSMVCLRQLQEAPSGGSEQFRMQSADQQLQQPKGALSLRQLVKEVIDDCERPTKMSTLTREILNRSDSLSSEGLAASASEQQQAHKQLTSSPLASAPSAGYSSPNLSRISASRCELNSASQTPQIKPIGIMASPAAQSHYSTALFHGPTSAELVAGAGGTGPLHTFYLPQAGMAATANDYSITSSLGTIDGLEFNPSCSVTSDISQLGQQQLQPQAQQQTQLHSVLKQPGRVGAYWKSLRHFSRFKMPKVNLAYLDNTNNFFADDDN